nr:hypothetical protein [Tanacetum cinerariifolium]
MAIDHAPCGKLKELNAEEAWETIEDCALYEHEEWDTSADVISDQSIASLKAQAKKYFGIRWLDLRYVGCRVAYKYEGVCLRSCRAAVHTGGVCLEAAVQLASLGSVCLVSCQVGAAYKGVFVWLPGLAAILGVFVSKLPSSSLSFRGVCFVKLPGSSTRGVCFVKLPKAVSSKGACLFKLPKQQYIKGCLFGLGLAAGRITKI